MAILKPRLGTDPFATARGNLEDDLAGRCEFQPSFFSCLRRQARVPSRQQARDALRPGPPVRTMTA